MAHVRASMNEEPFNYKRLPIAEDEVGNQIIDIYDSLRLVEGY